MANAHRWIILLLVWNLGLLVAGGVILALHLQKTPAAENVAVACAEEVAEALRGIDSFGE